MIQNGLSLLVNIVLLIFAVFYPVRMKEIENQKRIKPSIILTLIFSAWFNLFGLLIEEGWISISDFYSLMILLNYLPILSTAFFLYRLLTNNLDIRSRFPLWAIPILIVVFEIILQSDLLFIYDRKAIESSNVIFEILISMLPSLIGEIFMVFFGVVLLIKLNSQTSDTVAYTFIPSNYKLGFMFVFIFSPICTFLMWIFIGLNVQFVGSIIGRMFGIISLGIRILSQLAFLGGFLLFLLGIPKLRAAQFEVTEP